jgi:hypothetical protein
MLGDSKLWSYIHIEAIRIGLRLPSGQEHVSNFTEADLKFTMRNWPAPNDAAIHLKLTYFFVVMMLTVLLHLFPARASNRFTSSVGSCLRHRY